MSDQRPTAATSKHGDLRDTTASVEELQTMSCASWESSREAAREEVESSRAVLGHRLGAVVAYEG